MHTEGTQTSPTPKNDQASATTLLHAAARLRRFYLSHSKANKASSLRATATVHGADDTKSKAPNPHPCAPPAAARATARSNT